MNQKIRDEERRRRLGHLTRIMERHELEGVLIYASLLRREDLRYFTLFNSAEPGATAIFSAHGDHLLMLPTAAETARAQAESWMRAIESFEGDTNRVGSALKKFSFRRKVGIVGWDSLPLNLMRAIQKYCPGVECIDVTAAVHDIRIIKSKAEVETIRKAAEIADAAYESLLHELKPGIKEYEIVAIVEYHIRKSQGEDNFQILASGRGDARAMHPPTDRSLEYGDLVITEISPQYDGYFAQICRSMVIGEISDGRQKAHGILFQAQQEAMDRVKPGMTASDLAAIQNDVFRREGFGDYVSPKYTRGRGHGIGLYIDEEPLIAEGNPFEIKAGMVLMIHPNTFLPLSGYMVLGDPVLVTEKGGRRLSRSRRDLVSVA